MKKLLFTVITFFVCTISFAQKSDWFLPLSRDSAQMLADDIMSQFRGKYVFDTSYHAHIYYNFSYTSDSLKHTDFKRILVTFRVFYEGENEALEIKGTPRYRFTMVEAKFLDLFPFWRKYLDDKIDITTASLVDRKSYRVKEMTYNVVRIDVESMGKGIFRIRNPH